MPGQKGMFPVSVLEGVSHAQFGSGTPPSFVQKNDLRPDVTETDAHSKIGAAMAKFIKDVVANGKSLTNSETVAAMKPFIEAMILEGSEVIKPPCNRDDMINPTIPTCIKGSPWIRDMAVTLLVGKLQNSLISVINDDNFHSAAAVYPYHHPEMDGACDLQTTSPCTIKHISITQNAYSVLNELDTGNQTIAAYEMRVKMKSA